MGKANKQVAVYQDLIDTFKVSTSEDAEMAVTYSKLKSLGLLAVKQGTGPIISSSEPIYNSLDPGPTTDYTNEQLVLFNDIVRKLTKVPFSISKDLRSIDFLLQFNPGNFPSQLVFNFDIVCYPTFFYCKNIRDWPQYDSSMEQVNIDSPDYGTKTFHKTISLYDGDPAQSSYSLISDLGCKYTGANANWTWNGSEYTLMNWGAVKINPYITSAEQGTKRYCFDAAEFRATLTMND